MGLGVMRRLWNPSTVGLSQNCIDTDASCCSWEPMWKWSKPAQPHQWKICFIWTHILFLQYLPVCRYRQSCQHTSWDVPKGRQTQPGKHCGTLPEMAAGKRKKKVNEIVNNLHYTGLMFWISARPLTAVESGSLARLIPFAVRSVDAAG